MESTNLCFGGFDAPATVSGFAQRFVQQGTDRGRIEDESNLLMAATSTKRQRSIAILFRIITRDI